jgi:hypothetical protein
MEGVGPEGQETGTGESQSRGRGKKIHNQKKIKPKIGIPS